MSVPLDGSSRQQKQQSGTYPDRWIVHRHGTILGVILLTSLDNARDLAASYFPDLDDLRVIPMRYATRRQRMEIDDVPVITPETAAYHGVYAPTVDMWAQKLN